MQKCRQDVESKHLTIEKHKIYGEATTGQSHITNDMQIKGLVKGKPGRSRKRNSKQYLGRNVRAKQAYIQTFNSPMENICP